MLLDRLKAETRDAHDRIEHDLGLTRADLSLETYGILLTRMHGFFTSWEPAVEAALDDAAFLGPRRKLPLLAGDLAALGLRPGPACALLPAMPGRDAALGSLYVLEGSTLGGQVIRRHVEALFAFSPGGPTAYFTGYGADTGRRWQEMRARLAALPQAAAPIVVEAALSTFDALHRWLCPDGTQIRGTHV
jgi:heme oxygenase